MKRQVAVMIPLLLLSFGLACSIKVKKVDEPKVGKWTDLFDGKSLDGWEVVQKGKWTVEEGTLVGRWDPEDPGGGFLITTRDYADFILDLEFMVGPEGNSGVTIRDVSHGGDFESPSRYGYEIQIYNVPKSDMPTGSIYALARAPGDLSRDDEWGKLRIQAIGDHLVTWVNDIKAAELHTRRSLSGSIDLQIHDRNSPTRFRNIRIKPLERRKDFWPTIEDRLEYYRGPRPESLIQPGLKGWSKTGQANWRVAGGILTGSTAGGAGALVKEGEYSDFRLSLEYKITPGSAGGIYARSPVEEPDDGYRIRLFDVDDPSVAEPSGSITGLGRGLQGLATAGDWNRLDIYAVADQLTVWINGRKAIDRHDSKRLDGAIGFGLEAGKGQLQIRNATIKTYPEI